LYIIKLQQTFIPIKKDLLRNLVSIETKSLWQGDYGTLTLIKRKLISTMVYSDPYIFTFCIKFGIYIINNSLILINNRNLKSKEYILFACVNQNENKTLESLISTIYKHKHKIFLNDCI